ncbi:MAG: hypothetical protein QW721_02265 [Desulfurococcaceae archaeon]
MGESIPRSNINVVNLKPNIFTLDRALLLMIVVMREHGFERNTAMDLSNALCHIDESVKCSNIEVAKYDYENNIVYFNARKRTLLMLIHKPSRVSICQGRGFQVHVWGVEKTTIWILDEGVSPCVFLDEVFFDICDEDVFALSSRPGACERLTLSPCERSLAELLRALQYPLVVLESIGRTTPLINVVNHENQVECSEKKNNLFKLLNNGKS